MKLKLLILTLLIAFGANLYAQEVLLTPADAATGVDLDAAVTFDWEDYLSFENDASGEDDYYVVKIGTSASGSDIYSTTTSTLAVSTESIDLDAAGALYNQLLYWEVEAYDDGVLEYTYTGFSFTTEGFSLLTPVNGLTGVPVLPEFTWSNEGGDIADATTFTIEIDDNSDFGSIEFSISTGSLTSSGGEFSYQMLETDGVLDNDKWYYWRVTYSGGTSKSEEWTFKTVTIGSITLNYPSGGETVNFFTPHQFSWGGTFNDTRAHLEIIKSATSITPTATDWETQTDSIAKGQWVNFHSMNLDGGFYYYWRIIVKKTGGETLRISATGSFVTAGALNVTVTPSWPIGGADVYTNTPTAYWYLNNYASGLSFQVRYSTASSVDGAGALDTSPDSLSLTTNYFATFPTLTPGTTYWWQVRAYDTSTSTYGAWTSPESFTTQGTGVLVVPKPSYPTGAVTVYTTAPTLYWYLDSAATGLTYQIDYALASTGVDGSADITGITDLYQQLSGLTAGEDYEWRVRSHNGSSSSGWSATQTFSIAGGTTSYPIASYPTGNPTIYTTTPMLNWYLNGSSVGLAGYIVKYKKGSAPGSWTTYGTASNDEDGGGYLITDINTTTQTTPALTYGGAYTWAVASYTTGGDTSSYSSGSFTIVGGDGAVVLSFPIGGATIYTSETILSWYFSGTGVSIVDHYNIMYSRSSLFAGGSPITETTTSSSSSLNITGLVAGATYYWKVQAVYLDSDTSAYSSVETFVVDAGQTVATPIAASPINNVNVGSATAPTLSWALPVPVENEALLTYQLEVADNKEMNSPKTYEGIQTPYAVVDQLEAGTYYWRVKSIDEDGAESDYSKIEVFQTDGAITDVDDINELPESFSLEQNYPNPFNPETNVRFALPEASNVTLKIYNVLGQEVRTLVNESMTAGVHNTVWNGRDNNNNEVTSGIYIYKIVAGQFVQSKKMILLK